MSDEAPKVALITGAARRIGAAIARDLAVAGGWTVAIHYGSSGDDAQALAAEIEAAGGHAATFACDLMSEADTAALVGRVAARFGSVTGLVNNASVFERDEPDTATRQSWDRHMQVNLRAPFVLIQSLAQQLPAGSTGCVINLLDQRVWSLTPHFTSYTVSKMGLWTLTRTLAMALAPGIRVNAVGPGPTLPSTRQTAEQFARQWSSQPLARPVDPEEICAAVRFLLDAPSVTGQMIAVDAGQHLRWPRVSSAKSADE